MTFEIATVSGLALIAAVQVFTLWLVLRKPSPHSDGVAEIAVRALTENVAASHNLVKHLVDASVTPPDQQLARQDIIRSRPIQQQDVAAEPEYRSPISVNVPIGDGGMGAD